MGGVLEVRSSHGLQAQDWVVCKAQRSHCARYRTTSLHTTRTEDSSSRNKMMTSVSTASNNGGDCSHGGSNNGGCTSRTVGAVPQMVVLKYGGCLHHRHDLSPR